MNLIATLLSSPIQLAKFSRVDNLDGRSVKSVEKDLAKKPVEKWESILSYLALPSDSSSKDVSKTTKQLFQHIEFTKDGTFYNTGTCSIIYSAVYRRKGDFVQRFPVPAIGPCGADVVIPYSLLENAGE